VTSATVGRIAGQIGSWAVGESRLGMPLDHTSGLRGDGATIEISGCIVLYKPLDAWRDHRRRLLAESARGLKMSLRLQRYNEPRLARARSVNSRVKPPAAR